MFWATNRSHWPRDMFRSIHGKARLGIYKSYIDDEGVN